MHLCKCVCVRYGCVHVCVFVNVSVYVCSVSACDMFMCLHVCMQTCMVWVCLCVCVNVSVYVCGVFIHVCL